MPDPDEEKKNAGLAPDPAQSDDDSEEAKALKAAADKKPSNEATQELLELLGTVGNAGLEDSVELDGASEKSPGGTTNSLPLEEGAAGVTAGYDAEEEQGGRAGNAAPEQDTDTDDPKQAEEDFDELSAAFRGELYTKGLPSVPFRSSSSDSHDETEHQASQDEFHDADEKDTDYDGSSTPTHAGSELSEASQAESRLDEIAAQIQDQASRDYFQGLTPAAIIELDSGQLGTATVALFAAAERFGLLNELRQNYVDVAAYSGMSLEDITADDRNAAGRVVVRVKNAPPCEWTQKVSMKVIPGSTVVLEEQRMLRDRLDLDPLTSRLYMPDRDVETTYEISTSQRACNIGVSVPDEFLPENLDLIQAPTPANGTTVAAYARREGLSQSDAVAYFQAIFYKTNDPWTRQEAMQALRDEFMNTSNQEALGALQALTVCKATIELREAEISRSDSGMLDALSQLAMLEDLSPEARSLLHEFGTSISGNSYEVSLSDQARAIAKDVARSTFQLTSAAYAEFFSRETDKLPAAERRHRRRQSLNNLSFASEQRINLMARDDFSFLMVSLKITDAVMTMTETNDAQTAAEQLTKLIKLQMQDESSSALEILRKIHSALQNQQRAPSLEQIHKALISGTQQDRDQALRLLKTCLPDLSSQRNEYCLELIMKGLGPESSSIEMKTASGALEEEEKLFGNKSAAELIKWTRTGESSARIDEVIKARNLDDLDSVRATAETIKTEMERLSSMAFQANDCARAALIGMLMAGSDAESQAHFHKEQERGALVPDLSRLSSTERSIVREHAGLSVEESLKRNPNVAPLRLADASGLAIALAETYANGDRNVQKAIEAVFDTALKCMSRITAIDGLIKAMVTDLPGTGKLSELILKALSSQDGLTSTQLSRLGQLAREGTRGAIRTLAAICASDSAYASIAAADLVKAAANAANRDLVISIMLEHYQRHSDRHSLLAAVGDIASRDNPCRPQVMETLRLAIEHSSNKPDSLEYKSAQKGLLFLAENWGPKEIETLRHNLKMEMLAALPSIADKLTPNMRGLFISSQHEVLLNGTPEERLAAAQALGAMGRFCSAEIAMDLGFFTRPEGKAELERCGLSKDKTNMFIDFAARALLSMMASSNPKVQEAAFSSFRRQGDWPGLLASTVMRNTIIDYLQGRSTELEFNKEAMQFMYDAGLAHPLASAFRDIGVGGDKISTQQLLQLAEKAASNYSTAELDGKVVVQKVLSNATSLNALSPRLREKLAGSAVGIDMSHLAGQLINGTIDANCPPENPLFTDLGKRLQQVQRELEVQAAQLQPVLSEQGLISAKSVSEPVPGMFLFRIGLGREFRDIFLEISKGANGSSASESTSAPQKQKLARLSRSSS